MKKRVLHAIACVFYMIILSGLAAGGARQDLSAGIMNASEQNELAFSEAICIVQEKVTGKMYLHQIEELPNYDTEEEMRDYFLEKHPNANYYEACAPEEETENIGNFHLIEEDGYVYGYFEKDGNSYVIKCEDEAGRSFVEKICDEKWDSYYAKCCEWEKFDTITRWYNYSTWFCEATMKNEMGENFYFEIVRKDIDETEGEVLEIAVYWEGEKEPFQVLETEWLYIWSPSKGEFVRGPEELDRWWMATPGRRIATWQNVSGNAQEIWFYQWENEMDYRLIMWYRHEYMYDENAESYLVKSYDEDGNEVLLLDCVVEIGSSEADVADSLIDIRMDVLRGEKIQSKKTGEVYYVYLTRSDSYYKEEGKDYLYVTNEALYPVKMLTVERGGNCEEMSWYTDEAGAEKLQILYEDGSVKEFTLEELIGE